MIKAIFAPEHGFRGDADAGAKVKNGVDVKTGIPIVSLYASNKSQNRNNWPELILLFSIFRM